jgi:allantoinase
MARQVLPAPTGQPHRIKYLEAIYGHVSRFEGVLHWNGEQILEWFLAQRARL